MSVLSFPFKKTLISLFIRQKCQLIRCHVIVFKHVQFSHYLNVFVLIYHRNMISNQIKQAKIKYQIIQSKCR